MRRSFICALIYCGLLTSYSAQAVSCSADSITQAAMDAYNQQADSAGKLWGTTICNQGTTKTVTVGPITQTFMCFNACALVVSSILKKAGCSVGITDSASAIWNQVKTLKVGGKLAFQPSAQQKKGCIIGMNSKKAGGTARLTLPGKSGGGVSFRHVAVSVGRSAYIDNKSNTSTPIVDYNGFFDWTKYHDWLQYESFIYLCPVN